MPVGLPVALILLAQAAGAAPADHPVYGPAAPAPAKPPPTAAAVAPTSTDRQCAPPITDPNSNQIVVCAPRPQGYRIDPDLLAARRMHREGLAGRPHNPHESFRDNSCSVVGPAGCVFAQPGINLLAAVQTVGEMADRLSKGQEIGSLFITDPQESEYQIYQELKKERAAKEAAATVKAKAAPAAAAAAPQPVSQAASSPAAQQPAQVSPP